MSGSNSVLRVRNWWRFQHYQKGRSAQRPAWIKNYLNLDDRAEPFSRLSFSDQGKLQAIWRLAAKMGNRMPVDEAAVALLIGARNVPLQRFFAAGLLHVVAQDDLKKIEAAEKRAAKRAKPASKSIAEPLQPSSKTLALERARIEQEQRAKQELLNPSSSTSPLDPDRNGHHEDLLPEFHSHALDLLIVRTGANLDPRAEKRLRKAAEGASEKSMNSVLASVGRNRSKVDNLIGFAIRGLEREKAA